jgi:hypothetical protein
MHPLDVQIPEVWYLMTEFGGALSKSDYLVVITSHLCDEEEALINRSK